MPLEQTLRLVVGLGNPGPEYARNRHNVGFQVAEAFAARHHLPFDRMQKRARIALGVVTLPGGWRGRVLLAKPLTFMNTSGEAVAPLVTFYKVTLGDMLVISDDLDLPAGRIRLRAGGGAGGQKGLKSIIERVGGDGFARLRIGIGRPPGQMEPADYVLQNFSAEQEAEMALVRQKAADAVEAWLSRGIAAAMNEFNA